jgi:hypothetical protein
LNCVIRPGSLGVRGHVALCEDRRALGVEAGREEHRRQVERRAAQVLRVVLDRDRVQVDDAEEGVAFLLRRHVLAEAAAVVAEVLRAGGLDAAEDAHGRDSSVSEGRKREKRAGGLAEKAPAALATPRPLLFARCGRHGT